MYTTVISNPLAEILHNASDSYRVECYAFMAKATGYTGETICVNYAFGSSCWNVFHAMQMQTCHSSSSVVYPAVASELQTYGLVCDIMVLCIVLLCAVALVMIGLLYWLPKQRESLLTLITTAHVVAAICAVALMASYSQAISTVSYHDNNNKGQTVTTGAASVSIMILPLLELILDATMLMWSQESDKHE